MNSCCSVVQLQLHVLITFEEEDTACMHAFNHMVASHFPVCLKSTSGHARSMTQKLNRQLIVEPDRDRQVTHLRSFEALADIQIGGRLINHVHVGLLSGHHCNGKPLQLPT